MNLPRALPVQSQWLLQLSVSLWIWVGAGLLAGSASPLTPDRAHQARSRERAVQADTLLPQQENLPPGLDLQLRKEGEKSADALAAFSEGLSAEEDADTERALEAYRRALALDPSYTELAVKVAFELARRGDIAQGVDILKDSAKAAPKDSLPPLCLSQLYDKFLKKPEQAEKYALQAQSLNPDNFAPYLALLDLYTNQGHPKKTQALLERAVKSTSSDPQFWLQLGEVYTKLSLKEGEETVDAESLGKINPIYEKALACGKNNPEIITKVADYYVLSKQVKAAIPLYKSVIDASQEDTSSEALLAVMDKLARSLLISGKRAEAIAVLEQMVKDSPTRYETYELLGELYSGSNEYPKAIASYQQALLIDSSQPQNYLKIADLQLQCRRPAEAVKTLTDARARFPGLAQMTYSLAIALSQAKQHTLALSTFEEALQEAKNSNEALINATFYFAYGTAAEQAGDLERAATLLHKCIELDPSNAAQACNYLGYMWVEHGINLPEAQNLIKRALALDPENGAYLDSLGWYFYKTGKYDEALTNLQKAVEQVKPEDPIVDEHLGDVYAAKGDIPKAVETWKKALSLDQTNKALAEKIGKAQQTVTAAPQSAK